MKVWQIFLMAIVSSLSLQPVHAALTNTWSFSNTVEYTVSDSNLIEVAEGVARLKLQKAERYDTVLADYQTNGASSVRVGMGPDVTLSLAKLGGLYKTDGDFISRILDGGDGIQWQRLNTKAYNLLLENAFGGVSEGISGLVALYRFDNSWANAVGTDYVIPLSGASFSPSAKLGSASCGLNGSGYATCTNIVLNGSSSCTISLWLKLRNYTASGGIVSSRAGSDVNGFRQDTVAGNLRFYVNNVPLTVTEKMPLNEWFFLVATWSSADKIARVYYNGVLAGTGTINAPSINQTAPFLIGKENFLPATSGWMDDVAIYNRALSQDEITQIYKNSQSMRFQVRAGETPSDLIDQSFVGPGGLTNTYYAGGNQELVYGGLFRHWGRYAQYRAYFAGPSDRLQSPFLDAAGLIGSITEVFDNTLGDFGQGALGDNLAINPSVLDTPYVGLAKQPNGGYFTDGKFTSGPIDGGGSVVWDRLKWDMPSGLSVAGDMIGLWHMEGGFGDVSSYGWADTPAGMSYSPYAKFDSQCAVFTGASHVAVGNLSAVTVNAMEFWIRNENMDDGILELVNNATSKVYLSISGHLVTPVGFVSPPALTVNGSVTSRRLMPGWNHVGVTMSARLSATEFTVGVANGVYMRGMLDEMAMYSRAVTPAEFKNHYVAGRRVSAGRVKFQVRAGDSLPLTGNFVGPDDLTTVSFQDNAGGSLMPPSTTLKRYIQYQASLISDGVATPTFRNVVLTTSSGSAFSNSSENAFLTGTFDSTAWIGDEIKLLDKATVPGLVNLKAEVSIAGLWHMDESAWSVVQPAEDSSYDPHPGVVTGAKTVVPGLAGKSCGQFSGTSQYLSINGVSLGGDFSILIWVKTTATNRSAVVSRSDGACSLEVNSPAPGKVAFVVNNGGGDKIAVASPVNLNDGAWHHLAGIRKGQTLHIYVDGVAAGSAALSSLTGLGSGGLYVARHGVLNTYLACNLDELVIYNRALSDGDVRQVAAMDANITGPAYYTSGFFAAERAAIWESMLWRENASIGKALVNNDFTFVGLWHADEANGVAVTDSSGKGNQGSIIGSVSRTTGKFGSALSFDGSGGYVEIINDSTMEPAMLSLGAWVKLSSVDSRVIFDKRTAGTGYALGTDANGKPYFWVGGTVATSFSGLQPDNWYYVVGVYDGTAVRIYVNGDMTGSVDAGAELITIGNAARIGLGYNNAGSVNGVVDEVALWGRALNAEEIMDQARAGAGTLRVQVRFGDDTNSLATASFNGPDGTSNTYYMAASGSSLVSLYPLGRYFQYRVTMTTEDGIRAPIFQGATVNQTGYPINNPWVTPATGYGRRFLGNLISLSHILATNTEETIRYQISGNNGTNWYWWNGGQWDYISPATTNSDTLWTMANPRATIDANIDTFYESLYAKTGGVFKFKAFLKSDAVQQVALDEVKLVHAPGRIVVQVPNGQEVGQDAWLIGVPYNITWSSTGTVSGQLKLERIIDGVTTVIATNVPNTGVYSNWVTPGTVSDRCRIRITDMNDAFITDMSDSDFSLVQRYRVAVPNGGEKWYRGRSYSIQWWAAVGLGTLADIFYAADGVNFTHLIKSGADNTPGGVTNALVWQIPATNSALLSETGKIRIQTFGGSSGIDDSDHYFTLAGIEITRPPAGALVNRRSTYPMQWVAAGASNAVRIEFSANGGGSWTNVAASSVNVAGENTFDWNPNVQPTDTARLRITSLSDSNVVGVSSNFVLADIEILAPTNGVTWGMRLTNSIVWMAGGAGTNANLYYSTNSGGRWSLIVENHRTYSGSNSYSWLVEPYPGANVRIKIESVQDTNLYAISDDFKIAGVRVTSPNDGEKWQLNVPNTNKWVYQSVGESATLDFSYDGGLTYRRIGGPGVPLINEALAYAPDYPTVRAKTKITADDPTPFTNMFDESDRDFTVGGILVTVPTTGMVYTLGTAGAINWVSAGADDPLSQARISYAVAGVTNAIATTGNSDSFPGDNSYPWTVSLQADPSANARVIVRSGPYTGASLPFVLRGIKFSLPNVSSIYDGGTVGAIKWASAGIDESAVGYFYLSTDGGVTFKPTALNSSQIWPAISGAYPWSIDLNEDPTTNAIVKYEVASSASPLDVGYSALSLPFVLRGLKILSPSLGSVWSHNTTNLIVWRAARAGTVASFFYSANGVTYDATPIAANVTLIDGITNYAWRVEPSRMPSTNAYIKVVSSAAMTVSPAFTVQGIKVINPLSTDIWALDETNRISWVGVGTTPPYTISLIQNGTNVLPIDSGIMTTDYDWVVPLAAVTSNAVIRVTDGAFTGDSPAFRIVGMPTVEIIAPAPGDLWKVSQSYNIVWSKGGKMENNFRVMFSREPYLTTNDIFYGLADYNAADNTFSVPWSVPDRLGNTKIIVQHNTRSDIWDESEPFKIVPYFRLAYPNGGETNLYARKPHTVVSWFTRGSQGLVDLFYSAAPLHESNSWVKINSAPIVNNGEGLTDIVTTYDWTIVDLGGDVSSVRLRVAAADEPGAYDDSDSDFSILYYKIMWHVFDSATSNALNQLSVSDSSGWSAAGLSSPTQHAYPYGIFSTVWAREFFFNRVVFNWESDPSRSIYVAMSPSTVDPDYNVMANFVYDASNTAFRVNSWLERRGVILPTPTKCVVTVYGLNGNTVDQVTANTHDLGVFWLMLPKTLARGDVYFAKVDIEFSGVVYSSGITFNLRVPTEDEQTQQMLSLLTNIQAGVATTGTNLTDLATAQALFRAVTGEKLDMLTNAAVAIQAGVSNMADKVDLYGTQTLVQLAVLTNTIGVIGPSETNLLELVKRLPSSMSTAQREPRILTRPTTVKYGTQINILFRSLEVLTATWSVKPTGSGITSGNMSGGSGGIFEATLMANWGYGDYQVTCTDSAGNSDVMIIKVSAMELEDIAGTIVSISGKVSNVENMLSDMQMMDSNIYSIVGTLDKLTNLVTQVETMTNAMEKISGLTNMSGQLNYMTNIIGGMSSVTNMGPQLASVTNMMALLAPVTNFGPQIAYMTNVVGQLMTMTNIGDQVAVMTNAMGKLSGLTNMSGQLDFLTNIVGQLGPVTNLASQLGGLTGMASQVTYMTNVIGQLAAITNIGDQVAVMTGSIARVAALTNITDQMSYMTNVIGSLGSITNLGPQVDSLNAAIGQIVSLTNMADQVDYLVSVIGQVAGITNLSPQITILTNSLSQITALTNMSGQLDFLANTMTQMVGLTNMPNQLALMTNTLTQFAGLTNVAFQVSYLTNIVGQLTGVTNISAQVADMTNAIGRVAALTNMPGQLSYMTNIIGQLSGVTNIAAQVSDMTNSIAKVAALTNMSGQLSYMTNVIGQLSGMTNISAQVADMTNAIGRVATLTNMSGQLSYVTNVIGQLSGMTNISAQVAMMTNAIGRLSGITNLSAQVAEITNALAGLAGLGDVPGQLSYVTNVISSLSAVTNLGPQIAIMTNAIAQLGAMTNMASDIAGVDSNVTAMMGMVAGLGSTYEVVTNLQDVVSNVEALSSTMETRIGKEGDPAGTDTLFGMLSYIEDKMSTAGTDSSGAVLKGINSAKSAAQKAASAASAMKNNVGPGQMDQVLSQLETIRKSLGTASTEVKGLQGSMDTDKMVKVLNEAMADIKKAAEGRGVNFPPMGQPSTGGQAGGDGLSGGGGQPGPLDDPKEMAKFINTLEETKAMMQIMRGLMDDAVNKPVVEGWLEGMQ